MKAAVLYKPYDIRLEEVETPRIRSDQVLVRVRAVGICGSDVHYYRLEGLEHTLLRRRSS